MNGRRQRSGCAILGRIILRQSCFWIVWLTSAHTGIAIVSTEIRAAEVLMVNSTRHPVSVIEADVYVTKFKATMRLRCFAEDLELLHGVEALEDGFYDLEELRETTIDHADYLAENIQMIDVNGVRVPAKIAEIIDFEEPQGRIRQGDLMKYTIGVILEFDYKAPPEFLTIKQTVVGDELLFPSELKILLKQEGSDEPYFHMMKPDQPETFRFDWTNPTPLGDASDDEWQSWFEEQREKTLGITSYSSVYSFIYITAYQVRHEVLIPLATLNSFFEIERAEEGFLSIAEQDQLSEKIKRLFSVGNTVEIDQIPVNPNFDRVDFYGLDFRDFALRAERSSVSMANGRVGIIMSYSTKGFPRKVSVTWDKFNDNLKTVDSVVFAFDEISQAEFSMFRDDNTFRWQADDRRPPAPIRLVAADKNLLMAPKLQIPIASSLLALLALPVILTIPFAKHWGRRSLWAVALVAGCMLLPASHFLELPAPWRSPPPISEEIALDVFQQLHKNMFRAFDYYSEGEIYDALARSVEGDLLQELYLKILETLRVTEQGGAVSNVEQVTLLTGEKLPDNETGHLLRPAFRIRSQWELVGTVEHWGHIHERNNRYDAEFRVELIDDDWKITKMQVKNFQPEAVKTRVRRLQRS